jgi:hypothetical protein
VHEVPITPEKIVKALAELAGGKPGYVGPASFPDIAWPEALMVPPPWEGGTGQATNQRQREKPSGAGAPRR